MLLRALTVALVSLGLAGCEATLPGPSEADNAVVFGYSDITIRRQFEAEVRVRLTAPTPRITTERYAACIVAEAAQARGFIWVERLRGRRRIDGEVEDLAVIFILSRIDKPEGETVFSAALFASLCQIDGIPTSPQVPDGDVEIPDLSLGGRGAPVEGPGAVEPAPPSLRDAPDPAPDILPGGSAGPEPAFDPPPVDPVDGI